MRPYVLRAASLALLLLPVACSGPGDVSSVYVGEGGSYMRQAGDEVELRWREDGVETRVEIEGQPELSEDGRDIVGFVEQGSIRVRTRDAGPRRELLLESSGGGVARRYSVDGREAEWGVEEVAWLADVLERLEERAGLGAAARAERLLAEGGPMALARELAALEPGPGQDAMLARLLEEPQLDAEVLRVALSAAPLIPSESKRAELAGRCVPLAPEDAALTAQLLDVAETLSGSSARADLIGAIARERALDAALRQRALRVAAATPSESARAAALLALLPPGADAATETAWLDGAATITGSSQRAELLRDFLTRESISRAGWAAAVDTARGIPSESARAETLVRWVERAPADAELRAGWLSAASTITGSSARALTLAALLERGDLDAQTWIGAARVAASLPSETPRSELLTRMARQAPPTALGAVLDGVAKISSSSLRAAPLYALIEREDLDTATIDRAAQVIAGIPSDTIRAQVQQALIGRLTD